MRPVFRLLGGRHLVEREVDDEIAFHLEMRARQLSERGMSPDAAYREALRQFGDLTTVRATCVITDYERERTMQRVNFLAELRQDFWQALRVLRTNPAFAITVVMMLSLGIGANTAIFTLIDAIMLRTLPLPNARELVAVGDPARTSSFSFSTGPQTSMISYPLYLQLRDNNNLVSGLLASGRVDRLVVRLDSAADEAQRPRARYVSGNYFRVLDVPAFLGRTFDGTEDALLGGAPVVTISHAYWMRRFNGDRSILGRSMVINGTAMTIIGVTPPRFTGEIVGTPMDVWIPLTMYDVLNPNARVLKEWDAQWLLLLGRRTPAVSLRAALDGFTALVRRFVGEHHRATMSTDDIRTLPVFVSDGAKGFSRMRASFGASLLTLMVGVGVLLLIVCANVANLLLARSVARAREMTVRVAIGAGRFRIVRQLLTEAFLLALLGAAGGLALAWYGSRLLLALASSGASMSSAPLLGLRLDLPVLSFTVLASVVAVALFGLAPALSASRVDLASAMRAHARSVTGGGSARRGVRMSLGQLLIAGQVALSLVLLVGAGLLVRSLQHMQRVDTGLDREHLLIVDIDKTAGDYRGARTANLVRDLGERFARIPGVVATSYSENGIFSGSESATTIKVEGFVARTADDSVANMDRVGPGYVKTLGAHLLQGREFAESDMELGERVAMVNASMARHYFGAQSAVGHYLTYDDSIAMRIVGVVADIKDHALDGTPIRRFYLPYLQPAFGEAGGLRFAIRTAGDPALLAKHVTDAARAADPLLPVDDVSALSRLMAQSIQSEEVLARVSTGFGVLALLLASVGLYGVLAYAVTRRTGEIGLRVALGAQRSTVIRMVLSDAVRLVAIGVAIGTPLAIAGARLLRAQLHGVNEVDPVAIAVALGALIVSGVVAALIPALRASRVTPLTALREE